jgi:hypothetical protein
MRHYDNDESLPSFPHPDSWFLLDNLRDHNYLSYHVMLPSIHQVQCVYPYYCCHCYDGYLRHLAEWSLCLVFRYPCQRSGHTHPTDCY